MLAVARTHDAYEVGIICALPLEKAAVTAILDEEHARLPKKEGDKNDYTLGRIGLHNVVVACLPAGVTGTVSASTVAANMARSFRIKIGLMVGIGGGVPSKKADIRLGDVVVSQPSGDHGGMVQWDFGKMEPGGFRRTGTLNKPPYELLSALSSLQASHERPGNSKVALHLGEIGEVMGAAYRHQGVENDILFQAGYFHKGDDECETCNREMAMTRQSRPLDPVIFYGNIASGNAVMRDGQERDRIANGLGALCFEMEAAGLEGGFPCLVIRSICDYADSHKNKRWQRYAAATAAAYVKELLRFIDAAGIEQLQPAKSEQNPTENVSYFELTREYNVRGREAEMTKLGQPTNPPPAIIPCRKVRAQSAFKSQLLYAVTIAILAISLPFWRLAGGDFLFRHYQAATTLQQPELFYVPNRLAKNFVGRGDVLDRIDKTLYGSAKIRSIVVLRGLGGQGKSQVVLQYCFSRRQAYKLVFWLDGSSEPRVRTSIEMAASFIGAPFESLPTQDLRVSYFLQHLATSREKWLLVFDNYDDPYTFSHLRDYFPSSQQGAIIVTSRNSQSSGLGDGTNAENIELEALDNDSAIELLLKESGIKIDSSSTRDAYTVVDRLGNHALAIAQAAAFIKFRKIKLADFPSYYDRERRRILESTPQLSQYRRKIGDDINESALSVFTTWDLSMQSLGTGGSHANLTVLLMRILSMFHYSGISSDVFATHAMDLMSDLKYGGFDCLANFFVDRVRHLDSLAEAIASAEELSLLRVTRSQGNDSTLLGLHPLVQDWLRLRTDSSTFSYLFAFSISLLAKTVGSFTYRFGYVAPDMAAQFVQHLAELEQALVEFTRNDSPSDITACAVRNLNTASIFLGTFALDTGYYDVSISTFSRVLRYYQHSHGPMHNDTLQVMSRLQQAYYSAEREDEAMCLAKRLEHLYSLALGREDPRTLIAMANLALSYQAQQQWKEAEDLQLQVLWTIRHMLKDTLVRDDDITLWTMVGLAKSYEAQGRLEEAEKLFTRVLSTLQDRVGDEDRRPLEVAYHLASVYVRQERYDEAEAILIETLHAAKYRLGDYHRVTLMIEGLLHWLEE